MALSETIIESIRPEEKNQKLFDGGGLFLLVTPSGGKWWRLKYRFGGKEKLISLGVYPDTTLLEARSRRAEAKKLLSEGIDPAEARKAAKDKENAPLMTETVGAPPVAARQAGYMDLFSLDTTENQALAQPEPKQRPELRSYKLSPGTAALEQELLKGNGTGDWKDWREVLTDAFTSINTTAQLMRHFSAPGQFDPEFIRAIAGNLYAPLEVLGKVCSLVREFEPQDDPEQA